MPAPGHQEPGLSGAGIQHLLGKGRQYLGIGHSEETKGEADTYHGEGDRVGPTIFQARPPGR